MNENKDERWERRNSTSLPPFTHLDPSRNHPVPSFLSAWVHSKTLNDSFTTWHISLFSLFQLFSTSSTTLLWPLSFSLMTFCISDCVTFPFSLALSFNVLLTIFYGNFPFLLSLAFSFIVFLTLFFFSLFSLVSFPSLSVPFRLLSFLHQFQSLLKSSLDFTRYSLASLCLIQQSLTRSLPRIIYYQTAH